MTPPGVAPLTEEPLLCPTSPRTAFASVWRAQSRRALWHTEFGCSRFRGRDRPVCHSAAADQLHGFLYGEGRSSRSQPCPACAVPVLLDLAFAWARSDPQTSTSIVLACPHQGPDHARCPVCATLRQFAERHDLPAFQTGGQYHLVAVPTFHPSLHHFARATFAVHDLPDAVLPIRDETFAVAWALRVAHVPTAGPNEHGAVHHPDTGTFIPLHQLSWNIADLVTAAPAAPVS